MQLLSPPPAGGLVATRSDFCGKFRFLDQMSHWALSVPIYWHDNCVYTRLYYIDVEM